MKTLAIILYVIGSIVLIVSCFTNSEAATWWLGGIAVILLIGGCVCQFTSSSNKQIHQDHNQPF